MKNCKFGFWDSLALARIEKRIRQVKRPRIKSNLVSMFSTFCFYLEKDRRGKAGK